jgi:hypothetical protein
MMHIGSSAATTTQIALYLCLYTTVLLSIYNMCYVIAVIVVVAVVVIIIIIISNNK